MSELLGIARFKFHKGKVEEYKRLSAQAHVHSSRHSPSTCHPVTVFADRSRDLSAPSLQPARQSSATRASRLGWRG